MTEVTAILRDRVNDLLVANADLEKEVARLRYAHGALKTAERQKADLDEAKQSLNAAKNENDQLKLAVAKARYAAPPIAVTLSEKVLMNDLKNENEELKKEVKSIHNLYFLKCHLMGFFLIKDSPRPLRPTSSERCFHRD